MHHNQKYFRLIQVLTVFATCAIFGCSSDTSPTGDAVTPASPVEDERLIGKWNMSSTATLSNGHDVTANNDYEFQSDGTFTNVSRSKLLNGDTGEPFYTSTTTESGTWTVDGNTTCWTTPTATLNEFETFTDLITREMIEEGLVGDVQPECFTIVSADGATVLLQPTAGGDSIALTRRK